MHALALYAMLALCSTGAILLIRRYDLARREPLWCMLLAVLVGAAFMYLAVLSQRGFIRDFSITHSTEPPLASQSEHAHVFAAGTTVSAFADPHHGQGPASFPRRAANAMPAPSTRRCTDTSSRRRATTAPVTPRISWLHSWGSRAGAHTAHNRAGRTPGAGHTVGLDLSRSAPLRSNGTAAGGGDI